MPSVGAQLRGDHAGRSERAVALLRLQHDRPGAVAEQHASRAVLPVEHARERLRADHQRALVRARTRNLSAVVTAKTKPRAHRLQVERDAVRHAERGLDLRGGGGKRVIRRRGRDDHEVDVGGRRMRRGQRARGGRGPERRGRLAVGGDMALLDAGALDDPLVGRVDQLGEFVVGDDAFRQSRRRRPARPNGRAARDFRTDLTSLMGSRLSGLRRTGRRAANVRASLAWPIMSLILARSS